jgi:hypothetical protein
VTTRQERRWQQRAHLQHGQTALRQGLALVPSKAAIIGFAVLLRDALTSGVRGIDGTVAGQAAARLSQRLQLLLPFLGLGDRTRGVPDRAASASWRIPYHYSLLFLP